MKKLLLLLLLGVSGSCLAQTSSVTTAIPEKEVLKKSEFIKTNFPYQSIGDWKPGMKFTAEPQSASNYSSEIDLVAYKNKRLTAPRLQQGDFQGKIFNFVGYENRKDDKCPDENCTKTFLIFECEGTKYEYSSFFTLGNLKEYTEASVTNLVYFDEVEKAKELLKDKKLYVQDVEWNIEGEQRPVSVGKFLPVTITDIGVGTQDGPVKISFRPEGSEKDYYLNVRFSGINKATGQYGIDFDKAFSLEDPKANFPQISVSSWHAIQHKLVQAGMTKEECILSWGKAQQTNTLNYDGIVVERWYYPSGKAIKFKNGVVEGLEK